MKKTLLVIFKLLKAFLYLIIVFVISSSLYIFYTAPAKHQNNPDKTVITDITQLNPIKVKTVVKPHSVGDIVKAIKSSSASISIGGGRYSMGGQTAIENSMHLDMREYNNVISISKDEREVTVESGITWHKLQKIIDKYDLSVKVMQSYSNFTVGGSMSVNVHGRYVGYGPIISTIKSFKLILADGSIQETSQTKNPQLFNAVIGGYGGIGVISEVTLSLVPNTRVERKTVKMNLSEYKDHFFKEIRSNQKVVFHNADLYPPNYNHVQNVSWYITSKDVTLDERVIPENKDYWLLPNIVTFIANIPLGKEFREYIYDPLLYLSDKIVWRNWEASYDVNELGNSDRSLDTYVLNEYFVPVNKLELFVSKMRTILSTNNVDVINVSIRHALPDTGSYLAWAREEVFALVLYSHQETSASAQTKVNKWSKEMIDAVISEGGTYYLPYQTHATLEQFNKSYPNADKFFAVKKKFDPDNRFKNKLWEKYYIHK